MFDRVRRGQVVTDRLCAVDVADCLRVALLNLLGHEAYARRRVALIVVRVDLLTIIQLSHLVDVGFQPPVTEQRGQRLAHTVKSCCTTLASCGGSFTRRGGSFTGSGGSFTGSASALASRGNPFTRGASALASQGARLTLRARRANGHGRA